MSAVRAPLLTLLATLLVPLAPAVARADGAVASEGESGGTPPPPPASSVPVPSPEMSPTDPRLREAAAALDNAVPVRAESLARDILSDKTSPLADRDGAFGLLFDALLAQEKHEEALGILSDGKLGGVPLPSDTRTAFWKTRVLFAQGRFEEALGLGAPAASAPAEPDPEWTFLRARAALALGQTNLAAELASGMPRESAPERVDTSWTDEASLFLSRVLLSEGKSGEAVPFLLGILARHGIDPAVAAETEERPAVRSAASYSRGRSSASRALSLYAGVAAETNLEAGVSMARRAETLAYDPLAAFEAIATCVRLRAEHGDAAGALSDFGRAAALKSVPASVSDPVRLAFADALRAQGHPGDALPLYDELAASATSPGLEVAALVGRGECLAEDNPGAAAIAFTRAAETAPRDSAERGLAFFRAGETLRDTGDPVRAADAFAAAVGALEGHTNRTSRARLHRAAYLRADSLAATTNSAAASAAFLRMADDYPDAPETVQALLRAASLAAEQRDEAAAARIFDRAVKSATELDATVFTNATELLCLAHVGRGLAASRRSDYETALEDFSSAAFPGTPGADSAAFLRVLSLYNLGRDAEALDAAMAVAAMFPGSAGAADASFWRGRYLFNRGDFREAAALLSSAAAGAPDHPDAQKNLLLASRAYLAGQDWESAVTNAVLLCDTYPDSPLIPKARLIQGQALCQQGKNDASILVSEEIIRSYPDSLEARRALLLLGDANFNLGIEDSARYASAVETYSKFLKAPDLSFLDRTLAHCKIAKCIEKSGRPAEAFDRYHDEVIGPFSRADKEGIIAPAERRGVAALYSRAVLDAASLAETLGNTETARDLLKRLASAPDDFPNRAAAAERLERMR